MEQIVNELRNVVIDLKGTPATESNLEQIRDLVAHGFTTIADGIERVEKDNEATMVPPQNTSPANAAPTAQNQTLGAPTPAQEGSAD